MNRAIVIVMACAAFVLNAGTAIVGDGMRSWRVAGFVAAVAAVAAAATLPSRWLSATLLRFAVAVVGSAALAIGALDLAASSGEVFAFGLLVAVAGFSVGACWTFHSLRPRDGDSRIARVTGGFLLSVATISVLVAIVERVAIVIAPLALYDFVPDDREFGEAYSLGADDEMIGRAGFRGTMRHPEFFGIRVDFNDWGLRDGLDEAVPVAEAEDSVLVLGDSFAFGTGVELSETFHERIEESAEAITSGSLRVTCAAMPGNAQTRELQTLDRMVEHTNPDVVVVAFYFGNDFTDNIGTAFREAKAKGQLDGLLPEKSKPSTGSALPRLLDAATRLPFWLGGSSICAQLLPTYEDRLVSLGWLERARIPTNRFLEICLDTGPSLEREYLRDFTLQQFDRFRTRCDEIGADLVVLSIPSVVQSSPRVFEQWRAHQPKERLVTVDRRGFHDAFIAKLVERGIRVVDTLPALELEDRRGNSCYHREGHWNSEGHRIAAHELVPVLRECFAARRK